MDESLSEKTTLPQKDRFNYHKNTDSITTKIPIFLFFSFFICIFAAMNVNAEGLETQLKTFGFIFEQMCARDLRAYTADFGSHLSYYRDRYGLESDLVLHLSDGRYALIECKLGSSEIDDGAKHLLEIRRLVQEYNKTESQVALREPDLLIVLTGGKMAYTRSDGVKVIPLACLKD
jgi:predicted AAA+ superfamily ATPase